MTPEGMRVLSRLDRERAARRELEEARRAFERAYDLHFVDQRAPLSAVRFSDVQAAYKRVAAAKAALRAAERELMDPPPAPAAERPATAEAST